MNNLYWPIYKNLESEFNRLMFDIHVDDKQLKVYSTKIGDLITRAVMEVESITKDLYYNNGGTKMEYFKYDEDGLKYLEKIYVLSKKVVNITSVNCYMTTKVVHPFKKNETRTGTDRQTYSWNNAYQNIKHDRTKSLTFANIKNLFDAMAALYLLNIYYKDEEYHIAEDPTGLIFPYNQGSDIYSIKLYISKNISLDNKFHKSEDFHEYVFRMQVNDIPSTHVALQAIEEMKSKFKELFSNTEIVIMENSLTDNDSKRLTDEEISTNHNEWKDILQGSINREDLSEKLSAVTYKAIIIKEKFQNHKNLQ